MLIIANLSIHRCFCILKILHSIQTAGNEIISQHVFKDFLV
jgi:hypothetical protein